MKKFFSFVAAVLFAGSMMAGELLNIDFKTTQGEWTINNVLLPEGAESVWAQTSQYGMKASAYIGGANKESEAWLISPAIDLSAASGATMTISHARKFGSNDHLSVKASADGENWSNLTLSAWPDGSSWNFIEATADLADFAGEAAVQIAFVYTSTTSGAATWEIASVIVADEGGVTPPVDDADVTFLPADFEGQGQAATMDTPGAAVSTTKDGVTVATDNGYGHNLALRVYKEGHFSITSTKVIEKIKFQFYSTYTGGLDTEIEVNATSWEVESMESQARVEKIQIYFAEGQGIENVVLTEKAHKVMVDGVVYIVRDHKMFDITGTQVR